MGFLLNGKEAKHRFLRGLPWSVPFCRQFELGYREILESRKRRSLSLPRNEDTYTKIHFSRCVTWPGGRLGAFPDFASL